MERTLPVAFLAALAVSCGQPQSSEVADTVYTNGKIYTVNEAQPWAEAVAIRANKIVYVGDNAGASAFVGEDTESVDLGGRMMLPGFVDGHIHSMAGALISRGRDLQTDSTEELLAMIREYAEANPDDDVILSYGWRMHLYDPGPRKEDLDAIDSERPIYLWGIDGHAAWVNSKALEVAGVDKDHPDTQPPFSYYHRDEDGTPTGWVVEIPAQLEVLSKLITVDGAFIESGIREWLPRFSAAGITSVFDAGIQGLPPDDGFKLYMRLEDEGVLPFRVHGSFYWNDPEIDPLPEIKRYRESYNTKLVKAIKLKINMDGGDDKHNALYVEPYTDRDDGWRGEPILPKDVLNRTVLQADAEGIDVFCHCWGDGATRMVLDAVEAAIKKNPDRDRRHAISHTSLIHPDDVSRFSELGVVADFQLSWAALDPLLESVTIRRVGPDRLARQFGAKEVLNSGGRVSISSDWPVAGYAPTYEPLRSIQMAVTRQMEIEPRKPPLGGEEARLTLAEAIMAHTLTAAYMIGIDDSVGSIATGKLADLIVLEKNLFDVDEFEIAATRIHLTMMNGKVTHRDETF